MLLLSLCSDRFIVAETDLKVLRGFTMGTGMDKETEKAWHGWVVFTRFTTATVVAVAALLGLMALFLL
jgi:hypothetical protein